MKISNAVFSVALSGFPASSWALHSSQTQERELAYTPIKTNTPTYTMPSEDDSHEGTWLTWPWGTRRVVGRYEPIWVEMTRSLVTGEKVHLIVYDAVERARVSNVLTSNQVDLTNVNFYEIPTDDIWIRDNGPIFVQNDKTKAMTILNWQFNGWGNKQFYRNDNRVPLAVGKDLGLPVETVPLVLEGGSFEIDGKGTLMAKKSSIINNNRNRGWTLAQVEQYFKHYLGVQNFIWLQGQAGFDFTDDHIDGTARFADDGKTIVTMSRSAFSVPADHKILEKATNAQGQAYKIVELPVTQTRPPTNEGIIPLGLTGRGTYINYYVGNAVVLVPAYNDANDAVAASMIRKLYPKKKIVPINILELFKDGGMIHCVTQQQPAGGGGGGGGALVGVAPPPAHHGTTPKTSGGHQRFIVHHLCLLLTCVACLEVFLH